MSASAEEGDCVATCERCKVFRLLRKVERRDRVDVLPRHPQPFTARDQQPQIGTGAKQVRYVRCGADHLLEVVEHEQHLLLAQVADQRLEQLLSCDLTQCKRLGNRRQFFRRLEREGAALARERDRF